MTSMRIMSYNVRGLKDDGAALRRVIRDMNPDLICLQEMPRHPFSDHRLAAFAASVGMMWPGGKRHRMSTTLIASPRVAMHASGHELYDVPRPQEPRGYAWCHVSMGASAQFAVVSTHMSLYSQLRGKHAEALMADPNVNGKLPAVILGDFNELEDGPAAKVVTRTLRDAGSKALTSPAREPVKRIDFAYASKELDVTPVEITSAETDLVAATDHRPVVVDVTLPNS